jgi:DNA helicase HerA-like ATPase
LDNPVWYVLNEDLDAIFDSEVKEKIDYSKDFYLPIGTSPTFSDYDIRINPDQLFAKHAAILGNTGSGKSCTVSTLIQSLFRFDFPDGKELKSGHFIIFDTNGEYKRAFIEDDETSIDFQEQVNTFCISSENLKVPYWFMNYDDMDYLFQPSALTQAPILKRAVAFAKADSEQKANETYLSIQVESFISRLIECDVKYLTSVKYDDYGRYRNIKKVQDGKCTAYIENNSIIQVAENISQGNVDIISNIKELLREIGDDNDLNYCLTKINDLQEIYSDYLDYKQREIVSRNYNVDLPKWFNFEELISKFIEHAIEESEASASRIRENVSTLRLRLHSFLTDDRIADPLLLEYEDEKKIDEDFLLSKFLMFILGEFFQIPKEEYGDLFSDTFSENVADGSKRSQVTIIDLSLLPFEVLETITGLLGRLVMDFVSRLEKRGAFPTVLVLEEAQNYIPEKDRTDRVSISKKVFERVAREGRKYGVSLIVSSQRPSELSKTVLSQCNSFIIHRLQNPDDQRYVKQLVSSANEDILQQLPILPQQQAIIMGDAVRTPVQTLIKDANPIPDSKNPSFVKEWFKETSLNYKNFKALTNKWSQGEK